MWLLSYKTYIGLFVGGFVATYLLVPLVRRLALRLGAFDPPSDRRVHQRRVPTLGGLAVALPVYAGVGLLYLWPNVISQEFFACLPNVLALLLGGVFILSMGVYDDLRGASASVKLPPQILAGLVVCAVSGAIGSISLPLVGEVELGLAAVPITVFWIVAVTNAFNLIDGVDGLAAGVGILVCGVNFFIAHMHGHVEMMVFAAIMTGALLAFLRFNFHPATIFLGDTGSLFIGFTIAVMSLHSSMKAPTTVLMLVPICVLGYPLLDTCLAVLRRSLKGTPIFLSDRSHIHHKLLANGFGHRATSAVAYGLTILFTGIAILHIYGRHRTSGMLLALVLIVLAAMFKTFGYGEFVRKRLNLALRRKYRIYSLLEKTASLKMQDAKNVEELWDVVCYVAKEFDLCNVRLRIDGTAEENWDSPTAGARPEHEVRELALPGAGTLRISHNGHKDQDIELEQNILLERLSDNLARNIRRLRG